MVVHGGDIVSLRLILCSAATLHKFFIHVSHPLSGAQLFVGGMTHGR